MEEMQYLEIPRSPDASETTPLADMKIEVSPRRWVILGVFVLFCVSTGFQWVQYTIVGGPVGRYYGIPDPQLDWTSLVFLVPIVVFMLPACFLLDRMGLRWSMEVGGLLLAVGSLLKLAAVAPGRFPLALLGQTLAGASQVFQLGAPARVAATWFGAGELSTACALGVLGTQMGYAFGFLVSPLLVQPHDNPAEIGHDLKYMMQITSGASTMVLVLIILLFKDRPKLPPSPMQALERCSATPVTLKEFLRSVGVLLTNRNYILLLISSGISGGAVNVVGTVLNPIILYHFPSGEEFAGRVGLVLMLSGILGTTAFGILLDKTHRFKETLFGVYVLMVLSNTGFTFALRAENAALVYISAGIFGLFLFGYLAVSFEAAAEVTHPVSESTMGSLLVVPGQVLGCVMTVAFTWALQRWGVFHANMLLTASLVVGAFITAFIRKDYRRLAANTTPLKT